jgi:hypothetical protein
LFTIPLYGQRGDWYNDEGGYTFQGAGTAGDPYLISSVTALACLAEQINIWPGKSFRGEYFKLTEDIDLGRHFWIPVGSEGHQPFMGVFDGNGKTIRNLYIGNMEADNVFAAAGLFGHLGNGAKIENLTIDGGVVIGGGRETVARTGCLAGYLLCSVSGERDSIVIRNCHARNVKVVGANTETANTGGLVGEGYAFSDGGGDALILIENCTNSGAIQAQASNFPCTGGIAGKGRGHGYCDGAAPAAGSFVLRLCHNGGDVTGGNTTGKDAISSTGGILGFGYGTGDSYGTSGGSGFFVVENCLNSGTVTGGNALSAQAFSYTGGLLGYGDGYGYGGLRKDTSEAVFGRGAFIVYASANRGAVRGGSVPDTTAIASTGGISGFASGSALGEGAGRKRAQGSFIMRNCYSYAAVAAERGFVGGLSGWLATVGRGTGHTVSAVIRDSYAAGSVNRPDTAAFSAVTGGIAGRIQQSKEAGKAPQIGDCLVALSHLNGYANRTFRIAGQIQAVRQPLTNILGRNYAYVKEGEWVKARTIKNGNDWNRMMNRIPFFGRKDKAWVVKEDGYGLMPVLSGIPNQGAVPVP